MSSRQDRHTSPPGAARLPPDRPRAISSSSGLDNNRDVAMQRTIEVDGVNDELLSQLDARAQQLGMDRSSYLRKLMECAVAPPSAAVSLRDLLAPVHDF